METSKKGVRRGLLIVLSLVAVTFLIYGVGQQSEACSFIVDPPLTPAATPAPVVSGVGTPVTFSGQLDRTAVLAGGDGQVKMELIIAAQDRIAEHKAPRVPTDLVVILDRSGSMGGEKIHESRIAVQELIERLAPEDRFALVTYSSGAELMIPLAPATPEARRRWRRQVGALRVGGGTNMSLGLDHGLTVLSEMRRRGAAGRVILISDGLANEGDSSVEGLTGRAAEMSRRELALSAVGVGADFNEFLMSSMADAGTGNYYYLEDPVHLAEVFHGELGAGREMVAQAVAVTMEPAPGVQVIDAAGYPLERRGSQVVFRPGSLFAGQQRHVWVTLEVPHGVPGSADLGLFQLSYQQAGERHKLELEGLPQVACVRDENMALASIDQDTWSRSVAEDSYSKLRQKVARHVKEGRRDQALEEIKSYQTENARLNAVVQSSAVSDQLAVSESLESEVRDAFEGENQSYKQNSLSKKELAAGWDGRRKGSKKVKKD